MHQLCIRGLSHQQTLQQVAKEVAYLLFTPLSLSVSLEWRRWQVIDMFAKKKHQITNQMLTIMGGCRESEEESLHWTKKVNSRCHVTSDWVKPVHARKTWMRCTFFVAYCIEKTKQKNRQNRKYLFQPCFSTKVLELKQLCCLMCFFLLCWAVK